MGSRASELGSGVALGTSVMVTVVVMFPVFVNVLGPVKAGLLPLPTLKAASSKLAVTRTSHRCAGNRIPRCRRMYLLSL